MAGGWLGPSLCIINGPVPEEYLEKNQGQSFVFATPTSYQMVPATPVDKPPAVDNHLPPLDFEDVINSADAVDDFDWVRPSLLSKP